jgi:macrolide-specific efflux system membrane fusion protein
MNVQPRHRNLQDRAPVAPTRQPGAFGRLMRGFRKHPLVTGGLIVLMAAGAGYVVQSETSGTGGTAIIAPAVRGDIEEVVTALGSLTPLKSVDVGAQVSGQLDKLMVNIGDEVKQDQKLAEIEAAVTSAKVDAGNAQVASLQAQLAERQSQLALATSQAQRQERLMAENATSQDLYDTAQAAVRTGQAQVKSTQADITRAQSTLKADQATLGYSNIFAPMAGTVVAIPAKQGQTLNANQTAPLILTIADLSTMTVSTQVSEADVSRLKIGMDAYFTTLGSGERRWTGKLRQILPTPTVVNNVVLYTALFDVDNAGRELMPQMSAQVFFVQSGAYDVVTVPVSALRYTDRPARGARRGQGGPNAGDLPAQGAQNAATQGAAKGGAAKGEPKGAQTPVPAQVAAEPEASSKPTRAAQVTVVHDDGMQETRTVRVGVTDRVNAEIVSGLSEGERVVVGMQTQDNAPKTKKGGGPGGRGPVLFGG